MQKLLPSQFKTEIEQVINGFKLSKEEKKIVEKMVRIRSEFLTEKGGKQYNDFWLAFCSTCRSEIASREANFVKQNPEMEKLVKRFEKAQNNSKDFWERAKQTIGEEKAKKFDERLLEELENEFDLTEINNSPNNSKENSSKLPFYIIFAAMGIIIITLTVLLFSQKKKNNI